LARAIEKRGGVVVEFPTIEIQPTQDFTSLDDAINNVARYDWLIFTSVNGVALFFDRFDGLKGNRNQLASRQFAAIGPETAKRLKSAGIKNCPVPSTYRAEGILEMLNPRAICGQRVLIPRAAAAREVLPETLRRWGAQVDVIELYRAVIPKIDTVKLQDALRRREIDMVTFTSSSTVANFARLLDGRPLAEILGETPIACIGPITATTIVELGGVAAVAAGEFTIAGLVRAIVDYFSRKRPGNDVNLPPGAEPSQV
jgi:uroporphyrinogen III methyltransferase/synthase